MTDFTPVTQLAVSRRMATGHILPVGTLAQNKNGVYFQYDSDYLNQGHSLSPFHLNFDYSLQAAPRYPHYGLHGVFADALPDGWGMLLMDRVFRQQGIAPSQLTAMDRLAYIGDRAMGALSFAPLSEWACADNDHRIDLHRLGMEAVHVFEGQGEDILWALAQAGSSGGARPKAQVYADSSGFGTISTLPGQGRMPWLVKFTSASLAMGHEESLCEAVYLTLAEKAGIQVPEWRLIPAPAMSGAHVWLALKRFDCPTDLPDQGRYHQHSACGLLDADFRAPTLDYEDLIKATHILCKSARAAQEQFRRALFNLFALNQDDHSKNWSFLMDDSGTWKPSPGYDITFSPNPHGEHSTAFRGYGKQPPREAILELAKHAGYRKWADVHAVIQDVQEALAQWDAEAKAMGISPSVRTMISAQLERVRRDNGSLLG